MKPRAKLRLHPRVKPGQEVAAPWPQKPPWEEWDFRSCPSKELLDLRLYEYSREIDSIRDRVANWRAKAKSQTFEGYCELAKRDGIPSVCRPIDKFFLSPEWPLKPYLSIPEKERDRRAKQFLSKAGNHRGAHALTPLVSPAEWQNLCCHLTDHINESSLPVIPMATPETSVLALFQIDWRLPKETLVEHFRAFLEVYRPPGITSVLRPQGKASLPTQYRADLKALGAYRLREKFGVKADNIKFFSEASRVAKAVKRAESRIQQFEQLVATLCPR
jgi:hypothetical protein